MRRRLQIRHLSNQVCNLQISFVTQIHRVLDMRWFAVL